MTLEDIYFEFRQLLKKHFPELHFTHTGYVGSDFNAELPTENRMFANTSYFYKEELSFIHFTSIDNLLSILNNREIRLYNLHSSKDEEEFYYAAKELGLQADEIEFAKNYYYTYSFCKKEDLTNKFLWREYGKDSSGVAIEFSIENNPLDWDNFMISNVYYEVPNSFHEFAKEINVLKKQFGITISGFNIGKLIGFYKKSDLHNEKEVRIATYFPYKDFEEYLKFAKSEFRIDKENHRNRITNYISLPLWVDNNSALVKSDNPELDRRSPFNDNYFLRRPKILIKNIYFGQNCGLNNQELSKFTLILTDIIRFNLGYRLLLELNIYRI
ncbi:MAG TPA: DUF2971 domain-containing protein [Nitrosopumilaceae archaeon]|jgi:hypothetical protein|nr:DUF2971 domain-containing protein [Nitrosopumilaceae archaeon]